MTKKPNYLKITKEKKKEAEKFMTREQIAGCNIAIHTASVAAAGEAIIPIPVADAIPITATQVTMVIALGKIFNEKISESAAKAIIVAAASTTVGRSLIKLIPVAGWAVSAAIAGGVTEAMGWTIAVDLAIKTQRLNRAKKDAFQESETDNNEYTTNYDDEYNDFDASSYSFEPEEKSEEYYENLDKDDEDEYSEEEEDCIDIEKIFNDDTFEN